MTPIISTETNEHGVKFYKAEIWENGEYHYAKALSPTDAVKVAEWACRTRADIEFGDLEAA